MSSNAARSMKYEEKARVVGPGARSVMPETAGARAVDIPALMSEIRSRVRHEVETQPEGSKPFKAYTPSNNQSGHRRAGELVHSEELNYLNKNWSSGVAPDLGKITTHRWGPIGKAIVSFKRKVASFVWNTCLREYVEKQSAYNMRVVQLLNATTSYIDDRDASSFWELVRKIDYDVSKALNRIERIADDQNGSLRSTERSLIDSLNSSITQLNERITQLQAMSEQSTVRLATVESVASGVERIVARITREEAPRFAAGESGSVVLPPTVPDQSYVMLENRYRGSEAEIASRLQIYPPLFPCDKGAVLEIGAGRGELQVLFKEAGVPSYGIDLDPAMVAAAHERGAHVEHRDVSALEEVPDRSLGGVIAIQVVEHLTREQLRALFDACRRKVAVGGRVVFETINPQSVLALSSNYFRDPTHVWPLHPDTLSFAMTMAGLKVLEVRKLSPVPSESLLKKVPVEEYMTPRWAHAVDTLNRNIDQLNDLLFGFQDYAIVAEVL